MAKPQPNLLKNATGLEVSPLKSTHIATNLSNREELGNKVVPKFRSIVTVEFMSKLLLASQYQDITSLKPPKTITEANVADYFNRISGCVYQNLGLSKRRIKFVAQGHLVHPGHPTGTECRPNFVAYNSLNNTRKKRDTSLPWSGLEFVGEFYSKNRTREESLNKAASYMAYLLQARPDLISVVGIWADSKEFRVIIADACSLRTTSGILWNYKGAPKLLYALVRRLYQPCVDETIVISYNISPQFKIITEGSTYEKCFIRRVGSAFGRRTVVLEHEDVIIKEQWIEKGHRFIEGPTLERLKGFPGVVKVEGYGYVHSSGDEKTTLKDGKLERSKYRLVLQDKGKLLIEAKTPREVLMALYDLLEITRIMWRKKRILHRDISLNNILFRDKMVTVAPDKSKFDVDDMCFSAHLLATKAKRPADRFATKVLLIDFDMAACLPEKNERVKGKAIARTGTTLYMARKLRRTAPLREFVLKPMPQLDSMHDIYKSLLPNRIEEFPPNKREWIDPDETLGNHTHKLHYDAESAFWCLFHWMLGAKPSADEYPKLAKIKRQLWDSFTGPDDARNSIIAEFPQDFLHPQYKELEGLLRAMADQLVGDHDMSENKIRQKDEYIHEALQRIILDFLNRNYCKSFMILEKSSKCRKVTGDPTMQHNKSRHSEQMHFSDQLDSYHEPTVLGQKRKVIDEPNEGKSSKRRKKTGSKKA